MEDSTSTSDETRTNTQWSRRKKHVDDLKADRDRISHELELKEAQKIALERQVSDLEKAKTEAEGRVTTLETANQEITRELSKAKRTIKEHENLKLESGPSRTSYLLEPQEVIASGLRLINESIKSLKTTRGLGLQYYTEPDEETTRTKEFLKNNIVRPSSDSYLKRAREAGETPSADELARMDIRATAAEQRLLKAVEVPKIAI